MNNIEIINKILEQNSIPYLKTIEHHAIYMCDTSDGLKMQLNHFCKGKNIKDLNYTIEGKMIHIFYTLNEENQKQIVQIKYESGRQYVTDKVLEIFKGK